MFYQRLFHFLKSKYVKVVKRVDLSELQTQIKNHYLEANLTVSDELIEMGLMLLDSIGEISWKRGQRDVFTDPPWLTNIVSICSMVKHYSDTQYPIDGIDDSRCSPFDHDKFDQLISRDSLERIFAADPHANQLVQFGTFGHEFAMAMFAQLSREMGLDEERGCDVCLNLLIRFGLLVELPPSTTSAVSTPSPMWLVPSLLTSSMPLRIKAIFDEMAGVIGEGLGGDCKWTHRRKYVFPFLPVNFVNQMIGRVMSLDGRGHFVCECWSNGLWLRQYSPPM